MSIFVDEDDASTSRDTKNFMNYVKQSSVEYFNKGVYGIGYRVKIDNPIESKYNVLSLNNTEDSIKCSQLFVKLVPILEENDNEHTKRFVSSILEMEATPSNDFSNEIRIQTDVYKKTNKNLEAVCPPIVYSNILNNTQQRSRAVKLLSTMVNQMPNDENKIFLARMRNMYEGDRSIKLGVIAMSFAENYDTLRIVLLRTANPRQKEFYQYLAIYEMLRLYDIGYLHGDYHTDNILINTKYKYNYLTGNYLGRSLIIDYGMAFKNKHVDNSLSSSQKMHIVTQEKQPQTGMNAYTWSNYNWLLKFLQEEGPNLNTNLDYLQKNIGGFQEKMIQKINVKYPGLMERIRIINDSTYRGSVLKGGRMLLDKGMITQMEEIEKPSKLMNVTENQMTKQVMKSSDQENDTLALALNESVTEYEITDEEFEQIFNPSGMNMENVVNEYENTIQEGIMILNGEDMNGGKKKGYKKSSRKVQSKKRGKKNKKKTRNHAKVRVKCGGQKKTKKRVVFAECMSDSDCTLDKPECDEKNNICVQKMRFYGGKTKKRALKKKH